MKITNYLFIILLTFNLNVYADIDTEFENWKKPDSDSKLEKKPDPHSA